ncbi:MAG: metal-dependent hydrolase [Bacillota bacterium]
MDSITHTLLGLTTYGTVKKKEMEPEMKKALWTAAVIGSQIPDIDAVMQLTEKGSVMYQMWHRGLSHSIFMAPIWASIIYFACYIIWRKKDKSIFYLALLNVSIHIGSDSLNAWGTGLLEPFSSIRVTLGVIPIVDLVIWGVILIGFLVTKLKKHFPRYKVWRMVWTVILLHVTLQSIQGYIVHQEAKAYYKETAMSASFVPWHFSVIGKNNAVIDIYEKTIWGKKIIKNTLYSREEADLKPLFSENPRAEVLLQWAPFVVIVDDDERLGIYDPRFYRNGESFLFQYINKNEGER